MTRQLTPEHEALIERLVTTGHYRDADEVLTEALQQMEARERHRQTLLEKLQVGVDELDHGAGVEWTAELMDQLNREADEMFRRGDTPDPDVCP
ncbi:MAG TPA: type II toxin-antitoxin system ParD family antitoxin [Thermomicrobiales bacterium]|nr:type II toxin-antitoxin system ParD family antitoxin [Thermomicrobiales bacterium]